MPSSPQIIAESAMSADRLRTTPDRTHTGLLWAISIVLALLLNLSLFGIMPRLITRVAGHFPPSPLAWPVNIIHLPRTKPPPPVERKPPLEKKKAAAVPQPSMRPAAMPRFTPQPPAIDMQPQLPPLPRSLPSLALQTVPLAPAAVQAPAAPHPSGGIYTEGQLDGHLMALSRVPPVYPLVARHKRIEGWVKVKFLVTRRGTVEHVTILEAHPPGVFDRAVLRAVSSWRFKPGTVGGRPVETWAQSTLEFKLK